MTTHENAENGPPDAPVRLPADTIVVRGGRSTPDTLLKTALSHFDAHGCFAISVRAKPGMTATELAVVEPPLAHPVIRATTAGALRRLGYEVVPDEPPPAHALIMLPDVPAGHEYHEISHVFGDAAENPGSRMEQT
jgi:hypothetical protein